MENIDKVLENRYTKEKVVLAKPIDNEIEIYENSILITEIDKDGYITYANRRYIELSGFSKKTLIGLPYIVDRHPDMPEGLFHARDQIVAQKKIWRGYVKSLCRDGSFYWTLTYMQPKLNDEGKIIGYTLTRRQAYPESIKEMEKVYNTLQGEEHIGDPFFMRGELFHGEDLATHANIVGS